MIDREKLRYKFGGKCAYCGEELTSKFHADHVKPQYLGGTDEDDNLFPACPRCNIWKRTYSIEEFRSEIANQINRLRRDSSAFCLAEDFGLVNAIISPPVFWFEKYKDTK